jgi:hypothetical protein
MTTTSDDYEDFENYAFNKWWFYSAKFPDGQYVDSTTRAAFEVWEDLS